jgi:hypothetical protein
MRWIPRVVAVLLVWTVAIVWLTWPLAAHRATHRPAIAIGGPLDSLLNAWAMAHQSRALVTDPWSLPHGKIFWPARYALFYGEAGFGAVPFFMPVFLLSGNPALAINVVLLTAFILTACSMHLVVTHLTGSDLAGFVAAAALVTTPWFNWAWLPAVPSFGMLQYFAPAMLVAARPASGRRTALLLFALVVLQGLTTVYVAVPLVVPLLVLGLVRLARGSTRRAGIVLVGVLACAGIVLGAAYSGYAIVHARDPHVATQTHWLAKPTDPLPKILGAAARLGPLAVPPAALLVLAAGLAIALCRADGGWRVITALPWRLGAYWTLAGIVMAIRPRADWRASLLAAPHSLLAQFTPFYEVIRIPERLGLAGLMGIAVLVGVAFAECEALLARHRPGRLRFAPSFAALVLAVGAMYATCQRDVDSPWLALRPLPRPYPLTPTVSLPGPAIMSVLSRPGGPLLELPVGTSPWPQARAMWRAIYHGRALLNGYNGYWPAGFPERMALARRLPDPEALDELREATGLELVLVHVADYRGDRARAAWTDLAARRGDGRLALIAREGDDLLFHVGDSVAGR